MPGTIEVEEGTGNVFGDLGLPNPEERLAKADVAICIAGIIRARRLTQANAARIFEDRSAKDFPSIVRAAFRFFDRTTHAVPHLAWPRY